MCAEGASEFHIIILQSKNGCCSIIVSAACAFYACVCMCASELVCVCAKLQCASNFLDFPTIITSVQKLKGTAAYIRS